MMEQRQFLHFFYYLIKLSPSVDEDEAKRKHICFDLRVHSGSNLYDISIAIKFYIKKNQFYSFS